MNNPFRCVLHGSFRKHFERIREVHDIFTAAGIEVLAPKNTDIVAFQNGFALLEDETGEDPRLIELRYLHNLKHLGENGFSFFVNPDGYIGTSASYELGIAQTTNVQCFFEHTPDDHPAYVHHNSIWSAENLVDYIATHNVLPAPRTKRNERVLHRLWEALMVPGSVVATGGIIEYDGDRRGKEILLVKTHKWGGRYSVVGGRVRRNERLADALVREVKEETGLDSRVGKHLCTFDQIKNSGYYRLGLQHIFVDNIIHVNSKRVHLNEEAQEYIWLPAKVALRDLIIEPNARHIVQLYANQQKV